MKTKILISTAVLALLTASAGVGVVEASTLRTVGRHPVSAPLATVDDLKAMIRERSNDIQAGMAAAGNSDLFPLVRDYIERYPQTQISVIAYLPGQHIDWMLFRSNGRGPVKVARDVTWGGKAPLSVFEFFIDKNGRRYTFAIPLACGNLALRNVTVPPITTSCPECPPCEPRVITKLVPGPTQYINKPVEVIKYVDRPVNVPVPGPTRTVYVDKPVIKYVDRPVNVPGPTQTVYVDKPVIKYVDKPVETIKYVDKPVIKEVVREVPGPTRTVYVDKPVVKYVDRPVVKEVVKIKEVQAAASCCSDFHFIADASYLNQKEDADYGLGRLGVEYAFHPQFSFLALIGGAAKAGGDAGADAFVMDFLLQYNFVQCSRQGLVPSPFFMAVGIGAWMTSGEDDIPSEDSGADLIAELGVRLSGTPSTANISLFVEGRAATDELDELDEYGRIGGGLRFRF